MTEQDARAYRVLWEAIHTVRLPVDRVQLELQIEVAASLGRITPMQARELRIAVRSK